MESDGDVGTQPARVMISHQHPAEPRRTNADNPDVRRGAVDGDQPLQDPQHQPPRRWRAQAQGRRRQLHHRQRQMGGTGHSMRGIAAKLSGARRMLLNRARPESSLLEAG